MASIKVHNRQILRDLLEPHFPAFCKTYIVLEGGTEEHRPVDGIFFLADFWTQRSARLCTLLGWKGLAEIVLAVDTFYNGIVPVERRSQAAFQKIFSYAAVLLCRGRGKISVGRIRRTYNRITDLFCKVVGSFRHIALPKPVFQLAWDIHSCEPKCRVGSIDDT
jgi:hypothetical protein